ncbi:MAG: hypothetical protein ACRCT8_09780 [Lacipirellulaceae bacterium]
MPARSDVSLRGQRLDLELLAVRKWVNPPSSPAPGTVPVFSALDVGEQVIVNGPQGVVTSDAPGTLALLASVSPAGAPDLDLLYQVNRTPANELHVLRMILRATPTAVDLPTLIPSRPIYVILAPALGSGVSMQGAALYLERYLATIPEPASAGTVAAALALTVGRPTRRRAR